MKYLVLYDPENYKAQIIVGKQVTNKAAGVNNYTEIGQLTMSEVRIMKAVFWNQNVSQVLLWLNTITLTLNPTVWGRAQEIVAEAVKGLCKILEPFTDPEEEPSLTVMSLESRMVPRITWVGPGGTAAAIS